MGFADIVDAASDRAPLIIGVAVLAAVAGAWSNAPHLPFYALTISLLLLAVVIWRRRGLSLQFKSKEQLGFRRNRDWLLFELSGKGTPRGYYWLGFLSWLAVVLTGLRFPYAAVAIAGGMLTVAWAQDKRRYPSDGANQR